MRGRGRGVGRGRGRGRGRGSSRGRGRGGHTARQNSATEKTEDTVSTDLDIEKDVTKFFVSNVTCDQHYEGQEKNKTRYIAGMAILEKKGVEIAQNARIRALAAALARHDYPLADLILRDKDKCGLNEVLKAVSLLDSGRQVRVLEKRFKRLQMSNGKVSPHKLGKLKSDIDNLNKNKPAHGSASSSVCKYVQKWVKRFTQEDLEFYALHLPTEPWRKLADICHFNPKGDFSLDWFLPFCFGASAPEGTMAGNCRTVTAENVNNLLKEYPLPFAHVKAHKNALTEESKAHIAKNEEKLDTVLWWYEDLRCEEVEKILRERIQSGEQINLPRGKLLERLLMLKMSENTSDDSKTPIYKQLLPLAQSRMDSINLSLEAPIVVIGDASGSMQVAIRTSAIIAGILTALTSAKLVFFNTENRYAPYLPTTIEEVLQLAVDTHAGGGTTPAASLWPFYSAKEIVKTFIIVTDEEENGRCQNMFFDEMFMRYYNEVYPAKLVFVSFYYNQHQRGYMYSKLQDKGIPLLRYVFDLSRPDLTKLDKLFGLLSTNTTSFEDEIAEMQEKIKADGMMNVFAALTTSGDCS